MASNTIRAIGRATQGVRLIDIEGDDRAVSIARLEEQDETAKVDERPTTTWMQKTSVVERKGGERATRTTEE